MDDLNIYQEIIRLGDAGIASVLATVVESAGSSPRKSGAKMLVREDGSTLGTVGGGRVELEVIAAAREVAAEGAPRTMPFDLVEEYGHVCGGRLLVYLEPNLARPRLLILGGGHVGRALAEAARLAGYRVAVADERPEYACREWLPAADELFAGEPGDFLAGQRVDEATSIVIATTGFEKDFAAVRSALGTPAGYIGVIGSRRKREVLTRTLAGEGYPPEEVARVTIPVGLAIGAETPAEIAVSIMAQLIGRRRNHAAASCSHTAGSRTVTPDGELQAASAAG